MTSTDGPRAPEASDRGSRDARAVARPFVGREREMDIAAATLRRAAAGQGAIVLVAGEAGIGKSRMAHEVAALAPGHGMRVLLGRCYEGPGAPAFWPWVQILRAYAGLREPATFGDDLGTAASDVARMTPEIREFLPDLSQERAARGEQARFRMFDAVARLLRHAASSQPLVIVIDDLHGADEPSLLLLRFLAREMREAPLLVLGTFRDGELTREHPLARTVGELAREGICERITLQRLQERDVTRYIELAAGVPPPASLVSAIQDNSGGNPLFVTEIVRSLIETGQLDAAVSGSATKLPLPDGVRSAVALRMSLVSAECADTLTTASGFGREFAEAALGHAAGVGLQELERILEEALAAHLVENVPDRPGRYRFVHALVRDALYEDIPAPRRRQLHRRCGEALEAVTGDERDLPLAELAASFFAAGDARAVQYARRAGDRALALLGFEEAAQQYDVALRALERAHPADDATRCDLLLARGEAENRAGDVEASKETLLAAADIARRLGDRERMSRAALAYGVRGVWGEVGNVDNVLVGLLEEALATWGQEDHELPARLSSRLATALLFADAAEQRRALADRALATARRLGDPQVIAEALIASRVVWWEYDRPDMRLAIATEVVQLVDEARDPERAFQARLWRLCDVIELGDIGSADLELSALRRIADRLRDATHLSQVTAIHSMRSALEGRFREAEELANSLLAAKDAGPGVASIFPLVIWNVRRLQGKLAEIEGMLQGIIEMLPGVPALLSAVFAVVMRQQQRVDEARHHYERAVLSLRDLPRDHNFLILGNCLADVCAYLGDAVHADAIYGALAPCEGHCIIDANGVAYFGSVSHAMGLLARTAGRHDDARRHFRDAIATYTRMGIRPWLALAQHDLAALLLERGDPAERAHAEDLLQRASATAYALEMTGLERDLQAIGSGSPAVPAADAAARAAPPTPSDAPSPPEAETVRAEPADVSPREGGGIRREPGLSDDVAAWMILYDDATAVLRDSRGARQLVRLLDAPWTEFEATELARGEPEPRIESGTAASISSDSGLTVRSNLGDAGPTLDERARREYGERLAALRAELDQARSYHDLAWSDRVQAEIEALTSELTGAFGLAGRHRRVASDLERARVAVTKRLREVIRRVEALHPSLGRHLADSIRTGTRCGYFPRPGARAIASARARGQSAAGDDDDG